MLRRAYETEGTKPAGITPALVAEMQAAAGHMLEFGLLRRPLDVGRAFDASFAEGA